MSDAVEIRSRRIEHKNIGAANAPIWEVEFVIPNGVEETAIKVRIPGHLDLDVAEVDAKARRELHRISSRIAASGVAGMSQDQAEEPKRRRPYQQGSGSEFA